MVPEARSLFRTRCVGAGSRVVRISPNHDQPPPPISLLAGLHHNLRTSPLLLRCRGLRIERRGLLLQLLLHVLLRLLLRIVLWRLLPTPPTSAALTALLPRHLHLRKRMLQLRRLGLRYVKACSSHRGRRMRYDCAILGRGGRDLRDPRLWRHTRDTQSPSGAEKTL